MLTRRLERKMALLGKMEAKLLEKQNEVEEYIQGIEKSELRTMFRLYYIDNLAWAQVAMKMNQMFPKRKVKYTENSCWKKIKDILKMAVHGGFKCGNML